MKLMKLIKFILFGYCIYIFFPNFNGGIILFILKILWYLLTLIICNAIIDDVINYIIKNWKDAHLRYIDEREHIKGNTLANLRQLDFLGKIFRLIHYIKFNKKRFLIEMWYGYLENFAIFTTFLIFLLLIILFISIKLYIL